MFIDSIALMIGFVVVFWFWIFGLWRRFIGKWEYRDAPISLLTTAHTSQKKITSTQAQVDSVYYDRRI